MNSYILHAPETLLFATALAVVGLYRRSSAQILLASVASFLMFAFYRGASFDLTNLHNNHMICPCDGKVLNIKYHENHIQIAVFLNVHNVHVQYVPFDGIIEDMKYHAGEFKPAYMLEKSQYNERLETTIATSVGHVHVIQIAGLIARRIVPFHKINARVKRGDPFGLIKFGSRVDVWIPRERVAAILVKNDDRVRIGDPIAMFCCG